MGKRLAVCFFSVFLCSAANAQKVNDYSIGVDPPPAKAKKFFVDLALAPGDSIEGTLLYIVSPPPQPPDNRIEIPCIISNSRAICELSEPSNTVLVRSVILKHTTNKNPPYETPARASGYLDENGAQVMRYPKTLGITVQDSPNGQVNLFYSGNNPSAESTIITELKYSISDYPILRELDYIGDINLIPPNVTVPPSPSSPFNIPGLNESKYLTLTFKIQDEVCSPLPDQCTQGYRKGVFYQTPSPLPALGALFGFQFSRKIRHRIKSAA
ncbi:MAG: hypothetical protein VKP70_05765 [Cyanobacteriota bacterium]|nr:hypothetical protein [Cyanobacteriota bacterium]